jgi:hypothetical protein
VPVTPRAVEDDRDAGPMQRAVHEELVESPVEESRVDTHDRVQTGIRESSRHRQRVLLGDADVEDPLGETSGEGLETHRDQHRGGDRDDVLALGTDLDDRVGELVGPDPALDLQRQTGLGVDLVDAWKRSASLARAW